MSTATTSPVPDLSDRDIRQRQIVPPEKLSQCHCLIIGVGAIGRQVAIQLAAIGMPEMTVIDFDHVAVENLATQAYWPQDLDQPKVEATAKICRSINPNLRLICRNERFRRSMARDFPGIREQKLLAVFACVDSMTTRGLIWEAMRSRAEFFCDGRMNAEVLRVLASDRPALDEDYGQTLFSEAEAVTGACTARSTVYTASIAAGLMLTQFTKWLRGLPVDRDILLNLLSAEMQCR